MTTFYIDVPDGNGSVLKSFVLIPSEVSGQPWLFTNPPDTEKFENLIITFIGASPKPGDYAETTFKMSSSEWTFPEDEPITVSNDPAHDVELIAHESNFITLKISSNTASDEDVCVIFHGCFEGERYSSPDPVIAIKRKPD
ncbi:hypothetical protein [Agarilytica rhodophyticola]|uniref:hypothetical protein n=1 Tax=Agarilytica rhodophyticola TaxID=1737490 RepID=UPI000B342296|nr:hypothetical protein [Agarilytica rhodophyticola]